MHLDTYKGNFETVSSLNEWLKEFFHSKNGKTKPYTIIHGSSGNGKTFLVECIAKDYKVDLLRFTADDFDDVDLVEKSLNLQGINTENLSKIILIDDVQDIKNKKRLYKLHETCNYPLIFITNDIKGLDDDFRDDGLVLRIKRPLTSEIKEYLEENAKELKIECDCIDEIATQSNSIRTALQGLLLGRPIIKNSPLNSMSTNLRLMSRRALIEDLNYPTLVSAFRSLKEFTLESYRLKEKFCEFDELWHVQFFKDKERTLDPIFINNIEEKIELVKVEYKKKEEKIKEKKESKKKKEDDFCYAGKEPPKEVKNQPTQSVDSFF